MLVIFGANGRTGIEVLKEALRKGIPVRPITRDDRDARGLDKVIPVDQIRYADPDHPTSLPPVLVGATQIVSCIDPRTAGPEAHRYTPAAGANILKAAVEAGVPHMLHLSVVGGYRWSPNALNRASFKMDRQVRVLKDLPWTMMRVSCYHDEVLDGHVRPPDGRSPHPIRRSARYSPISRADVGRMVVGHLADLIPSRTLYVGGPVFYTGDEIRALITPHLTGSGRRTSAGSLPPGDVSVSPDTTRVMVMIQPRDRFEWALDPASRPAPVHESPAVYERPEPGPHPSDMGKDYKVIRPLGSDLRRVVHSQLVTDLERLGLPTDGVQIDFRNARARRNDRMEPAHDGEMRELTGVRVLSPDGELLYRGAVNFLRDKMAEQFHCWWERTDGLPLALWDSLDMGVRRRLTKNPAFQDDLRVQSFASGHEAVPV